MIYTIQSWAGDVKQEEVPLNFPSTLFESLVEIEGAIPVARRQLEAISQEKLPYTISLDGVVRREKVVSRQPTQLVD